MRCLLSFTQVGTSGRIGPRAVHPAEMEFSRGGATACSRPAARATISRVGSAILSLAEVSALSNDLSKNHYAIL